jgi:outer membrane receptor protein involved in Fe transport
MPKNKLFIISILLLLQTNIFAQQLLIKVRDNANNKAIPGAAVSVYNDIVYTDTLGEALFTISTGNQDVDIQANGYVSIQKSIKISADILTQPQTVTYKLISAKKEINAVTVSGSRFQKRTAEEIVSIEIIKPEFIKNAAIHKVDEALNKLPGVNVIDNQINIRGGAGWSYGAGSRVIVMLDDMPMLSADAQDAKWDFLPLENCEQIEVMKGAASTLYGSNALNGVVNFRTAYARNKPVTKIQLFNGLYGNPSNKKMIWWGKKQPSFQGGYASHSRKVGRADLVFGSAWYAEDSYLQGDATRRIRFNSNIRHKSKAISGLTYGINTNLQIGKTSTFFLHVADTSLNNLLSAFGGTEDSTTTLNKNDGTRFNVDPYITYVSSKGWQHHLRTRYFVTQNLIPEKAQTSTGKIGYAEYQFLKKWNEERGLLQNLNIIGGVVGTASKVTGELYGNHNGYNLAQYLQLEKKVGNVWMVAGARLETNALDTIPQESRPVLRCGLNYEPTRGTNIRASWGQGYRYPTIAERFIQTNFGASSVYPNPNLISEKGYSAEIGIKQGFSAGHLLGFMDVAGFYMQYQDMMEFNFGVYTKDSFQAIGFQSKNIGNTSIAGIDISLFAQYAGKINQNIILGYTYINPKQLNIDSAILVNYSTNQNFLKYRFAHNIKATWEGSYKRWNAAFINTINSPMVNIDEVFENSKPAENIFGQVFEYGTLPKGLNIGAGLASTVRKYREAYNVWQWIGDVRLGYQINPQLKMAIVVKNISNTSYYIRPAMIGPIRNFTLQLFADL